MPAPWSGARRPGPETAMTVIVLLETLNSMATYEIFLDFDDRFLSLVSLFFVLSCQWLIEF